MRARPFVGIAVVAYGLFLAATIPGSLIATRVEGWADGKLRLANTTGTVWRGTATPTVRIPGAGNITIDRARWSWKPLALFRGQLAFDVDVTIGELEGRATLARTLVAWEASQVSAQGPAAALASLHPLLATWQPTGIVSLESGSFRFDGKAYAGSARADWRDARLALSPANPLGAWRIEIVADNGAAKATLATQRGPLRLSGEGTLAPTGTLAFSGEARAEAGREADLAPLLAAIGPKRADGAHAFALP